MVLYKDHPLLLYCILVLSGLVLTFRGYTNSTPTLPAGDPPDDKTIRTELGLSPEELVRNVFVAGTCYNITEIVGLGNPEGIGYFENGSYSIGLDRGIILSTGPITHAASPNSTGDRSGDFDDKKSDPDLSKLATGPIRDRVGLEFDFIPLDSFVTFRYVFASEEYCEFVGSKYNDVFGFFVRGPGIEGGFTGNAKNVALIPGSQDFVSINNVNHKRNKQYYINNTRERDAERCSINYTPSEKEQYIEYDGFTVVLTALLKLDPCENYHIRLVVADVADNFYDSAVFLEAGSFDVGGQVYVDAVVEGGGAVSEGCTDSYFEFKRDPSQSDALPLNVRFRFNEFTTAEPGVDFMEFPLSITIPKGQRSVKLPVEVYNDEIKEGEEKIVIALDIPCACYSDDAEISIIEPPDLFVRLEDMAICPDQTVFLVPDIEGGNPDYRYYWSNGSTGERLEVSHVQDDPYYLTVTDACGHSVSTSATVIPSVPPDAIIAGQVEICEGDTAWLAVSLSGIAPWDLSYSLDGEEQPLIENIHTNPYYLPASEEGDYELLYFSDAGCVGNVSGLASVEVLEVPINVTTDPVRCTGEANGQIDVNVSEEFPPYSYSWQGRTETSTHLNNLEAGIYTFRITDGRGCTRVLPIEITAPDPLLFQDIDCSQIKTGTWMPTVIGGSPPYQFQLDGNTVPQEELITYIEPGFVYDMTIRDTRGCTLRQDLLAPFQGQPAVELPAQINLILGSSYQFQPVLNLPESLVAGIRWLPEGVLSCDDCLNPVLEELQEGIYTIRVKDRFGCTTEAETEIILNTDYPIYIPNAFSPNGDAVNEKFGVMAHPAVVSTVVQMTIYNRWGSIIFQVQDVAPDDGRAFWDGTISGRAAASGIYVYQLEVELTNGERKSLMGDVLLVR
ncbi:MAG: choice-of-anchor L domain-containing protein [Saprospiraceae bacterium]